MAAATSIKMTTTTATATHRLCKGCIIVALFLRVIIRNTTASTKDHVTLGSKEVLIPVIIFLLDIFDTRCRTERGPRLSRNCTRPSKRRPRPHTQRDTLATKDQKPCRQQRKRGQPQWLWQHMPEPLLSQLFCKGLGCTHTPSARPALGDHTVIRGHSERACKDQSLLSPPVVQ